MSFNRKAALGTFWYTNAAPQYPLNNQQAWRTIEQRIEEFGINKAMFILTGISLEDDSDDRLNIPRFFWKLPCAKNTFTNRETTIGIIIGNNIGLNTVYLTSQNKIRSDLNNSLLWDHEIARRTIQNRDKVRFDGLSSVNCGLSLDLTADDERFWSTLGPYIFI